MNPHPPVDAELAPYLSAIQEALPPASSSNFIQAMRDTVTALSPSDDDLRRGGAVQPEEITIPGPDGAPDVRLLVCRPTETASGGPCIYHCHGGGMISGDRRTGLTPLLDWVVDLNATLVSVEYRLAPENPYPAPLDDCYVGLCWTAEHAHQLNFAPGDLLVAGTSAGGGLAAALALLSRDRGGPSLLGQLLMCPMLDDRDATPSSQELDGEGVWDRHANLTGWTAFLGDLKGGPDVSPYAAPARAVDLGNLPATFVDVGSMETFRDEDVEYASRICQAGGDVELHVWPGGFHGFDQVAPDAALSKAATRARTDWLHRLLARSAP